MEEIAKRILELLKTDEPLRKAVLELIESKTDANRALAEFRRRRH